MTHCFNDSVTSIAAYNLVLLTCGNSACIYVNSNKTTVLKQIRPDYSQYLTLQREACTLQALRQFTWAPKLICQTGDYLLTTYMGESSCKDNLPHNYARQVRQIVSDMTSVSVRHNDMSKSYANDFVILRNRVSLVDFGWATIRGNLAANCTFNNVHLFAPNYRPHTKSIDNGFKARDETLHTIPPCKKKLQFEQSHRAGSQAENPSVRINGETVHVRGYQRFIINSDGSFIFQSHARKYKYIQKVIIKFFGLGLTSFSDIGSNTGLVSLMAARTGYSQIDAFDHDEDAIAVLKKIKAARKIETIHAHNAVFGTVPLPISDVVFCGALIHWIFCLTSNFRGDFYGILEYLFRSVHQYLILEWVAPTDGAIVSFNHTKHCKKKYEYTTTNFEKAMRSFGQIESIWEYTHSRIVYIIKRNISV